MGVPAAQRLHKSAEFERVRSEGKRFECGPFLVQIRLPESQESGLCRRLGVVASKRVGNAVHRNRAKRWMREVFRRNQDVLPSRCEVVMVARRKIFAVKFEELEARFRKTVSRLARQNQ